MQEGRTEPTRQGHKVPESRRTSSLLYSHSPLCEMARWGRGFPTVCLRCCRMFCGVSALTLMIGVQSGGVLRVLFAGFPKTPGWGTTREFFRTSEAWISSWEKGLAKRVMKWQCPNCASHTFRSRMGIQG